jgi:hypothetical protein
MCVSAWDLSPFPVADHPPDLDQVTLAPNLVIANQSIGDAMSYADFEGVDGIVGVGPVILTQGTLSPDTNALIPTVMNNLVSQGLIEDQILGVHFAPATSYSDTSEPSLLSHLWMAVPEHRYRRCIDLWGDRLVFGKTMYTSSSLLSMILMCSIPSTRVG